MTKRAAIILSGGKAERFQTTQDKWQDKALAKLNGKPLLIHAIENIQEIVDEIFVVVNEEARRTKYQDILLRHQVENTRIVTDVKINHLSGPLIAILTGLKFSKADYCLTIPADMPMVSEKVADYMFNEIKNSYVAVPMWPNSSLETLMMVLERHKILKITNLLCELDRSRPGEIIRAALNVLFVSPLDEIKNFDPELKSFVNINTQKDLSQLQPRQGKGPFIKNMRLTLGILPTVQLELLLKACLEQNITNLKANEIFSSCAVDLEKEKSHYWAAVSREFEAKSLLSASMLNCKCNLAKDAKTAFLKAACNYSLEAKIYEKNCCYLLAERAKADEAWCELQVMRNS